MITPSLSLPRIFVSKSHVAGDDRKQSHLDYVPMEVDALRTCVTAMSFVFVSAHVMHRFCPLLEGLPFKLETSYGSRSLVKLKMS